MNGIRLPRVILTVAAVVLALPVSAAVRTVTSTGDSGPGTLRAAILASADSDSVVFDPSIALQTITLTSGEIDINASISMTGGVTLSGNSASRIFKVAAGKTVSLQALKFTDGLARGADGAAGVAGSPGFGGAIWNRGTLHLLSCTFDVNQARGGTSAINPSGVGGVGGDASGGAIYNDIGATLDISSCEFDNNSASGGVAGAGTPGGVGGSGFGGAIWSEGNVLTISGSRFIGNVAAGGSGGAANGNGGSAAGGAVWTADQQFSVTDATFLTSVADGGFGVAGTGRGGDADGGALLVESDTAPTIDRSTFDGNSADGGVTLTDMSHWGTSRGGAISQVGVLTIRTSTMSNNRANSPLGEGGGIYSSGNIAVTNCTIAGNQATFGSGGGFSSAEGSTLTNVTISANTANGPGGIHIGGGPTSIVNTIVAKNTTFTSDPDGLMTNASVVSGGHNVIGVAFGGVSGGSFTPAAGDQIGTAGTPLDPALTALGNAGGPTATMALTLASPALDHGDDASCPATDQTTVTTRPQGAHCDVGAYELEAIAAGKAGAGDAFTLTVNVTGPGSVTSAPSAGIGCPAACADAYFPGTGITLTETPAAGSAFLGWSGACAGVASTAPVTMNSNLTCSATFMAPASATPIPTAGPGALAGLTLLLGIAGWTVLRKM